MRFVLVDDRDRLDIVYQGIVDDSFKPGSDLIAVGTYRADGVFNASAVGRPGSLCNTCH